MEGTSANRDLSEGPGGREQFTMLPGSRLSEAHITLFLNDFPIRRHKYSISEGVSTASWGCVHLCSSNKKACPEQCFTLVK